MTFNPGDVVTVDFPGVTGIKRRPAVVLSSSTYHLALACFHCNRKKGDRISIP